MPGHLPVHHGAPKPHPWPHPGAAKGRTPGASAALRPPVPRVQPTDEEVAVLVSEGKARAGLMLDAPYERGREAR